MRLRIASHQEQQWAFLELLVYNVRVLRKRLDTMLPTTRHRLLAPLLRLSHRTLTTTPTRLSTTHDNPVIVNDPSPPSKNPSSNPNPPHKPSTGTIPVTAAGSSDRVLVEDADEGEKKRVMQAPNRAERWSRSQKPREQAMVGPRFEQTIMEAQVCCIGNGWGVN